MDTSDIAYIETRRFALSLHHQFCVIWSFKREACIPHHISDYQHYELLLQLMFTFTWRPNTYVNWWRYPKNRYFMQKIRHHVYDVFALRILITPDIMTIRPIIACISSMTLKHFACNAEGCSTSVNSMACLNYIFSAPNLF